MRKFKTGATRNEDADRPDYEGFLSPLVIERFGEYMQRNRRQADGTMRDSDNWQRGIPLPAYAKSFWRHALEFWKLHRGYGPRAAIEDACCAILFNVSGYLHETILRRKGLAARRPMLLE